MEERPIEHCPFCNTDLVIEYYEKNELKYGSKKIGIYDRELDMVTHFQCPFCKGIWERKQRGGFC